MNDIVGLSEYLVIGVAVVLLVVAVMLTRRQARTAGLDRDDAASDTAGEPVKPSSVSVAPLASTHGAMTGAASPHSSPEPQTWKVLAAGVVLAMVAVGLAAELWDTPSDLATFWLLLAVGACFAVLASTALGWGRHENAGERSDDATADRDVRRSFTRSGVLLCGAGLAVEATALGLFFIGRGLSLAWLLHLSAVTLIGLGFWRGAERSERRLVTDWCRADTIAVTVVVLAALAVRVWRIDSVPEGLWFDESQRGLEALRMLAERGYRPIFAADILQEPTGLWYLMMPLLAVFGRDALALRLPVALAGALGVGAIYLLARVLYGRRAAVVAAGLAVALTWHLNFSRIALPAVLSLTCDTLAATLFLAGLKRKSRLWLGLAGLACGAGMYFYFTSQLMPFVLALAAGRQLIAYRLRLPRQIVVGLLVCALAFVVTLGPFALFALTRSEQFLARADAVNVMRDVQNAHSWEPVWANVRAHLLMFQVHGDNNGRHNWTGRPMLDPVVGGLSILGLGLALARVGRLEQTFLLGWIPIALAGGILSSIWDAPQSHRSIDALVPAVLLAALPLGLLWRHADQLFASKEATSLGARFIAPDARLRQLALIGIVVAILVATGVANLDRYFRLQQPDEKTWTDFMAPQTLAGRQVAALSPNVTTYLEPNWAGHPSVRFLDPVRRDYVPFDPGISVPVMTDSAAIFIGDRPSAAQRIAAMYPAAVRTVTVLPRTDRVFGYGFVLSPEVVQSTRGVAARYEGGAGVIERREPTLAFDFATNAPITAPFAATWTASLSVPTYATYRLRLDGPPTLTLTLDGIDVLKAGAETSVKLARGLHALQLSGSDLGSQPVRLLWAAPNEDLHPIPGNLLNLHPVETEGLVGRVYRGEQPTGEPVVEQVDPNVDLRVHLLPAPRPYTLEWRGSIRIERDGRYRFGLSSLGASAIWIDGADVTRKGLDAALVEGEIELRRGWHEIRIRFVDVTDFSYVTAFWQPPGGERTPIPPSALRPWPPDRVPSARPDDADLP